MPKTKKVAMPSQNELVLCTVNRITPYAAWCKLDEYGTEGMIHVSEVAGKWVHDIREFVKTGKQYVAKVVRVDPEKNIVNLSLKRVSRKDEKDKLNYVHQQKRADKILFQAAQNAGVPEKEMTAASEIMKGKFGELFAALEEIGQDDTLIQKMGINKKLGAALAEILKKTFKERETVIKAEIDVKSYKPDGVNRIKSILKKLESNGIEVRYLSAPRYRIEMKTTDPKAAEKKVRESLESVIKDAKKNNVEMSYKIG